MKITKKQLRRLVREVSTTTSDWTSGGQDSWHEKALNSGLINDDGTRTTRARLLSIIARQTPPGLRVDRLPVLRLIEDGFVDYFLSPAGGYRASISSLGLNMLAHI